MQYRENRHFESLSRLLLSGLTWVGVIGIAWNLLKPGGWLFRIIDLVMVNQPAGFYYLAVGALGLLAGKVWLDRIDPRAFYNLLAAIWACEGTFFILRLLLPL